MTETMQPLAIIRGYDDLHAALRARAEELLLSRQTVDEVAGLTAGYAAKLLAPKPMKILGPMSFGSLLGALGLKLVVVEDAEAMAKYAHNRVERTENMVRAVSRHWVITANFLRTIQSKGGIARAKSLSPYKRRAIARKAAKARWNKPSISNPPTTKSPKPRTRAITRQARAPHQEPCQLLSIQNQHQDASECQQNR